MPKRDYKIKRLPQRIMPGLHIEDGHFGPGTSDMGRNRNRIINLYRPERVSLAPQRRVTA